MNNKDEIYYRGESKKYYNHCVPSLFRIIGEENRLFLESKYYQLANDFMKDIKFFSKEENDDDIKYFKFIVALQHYGFGTRLLDITKKYEIAKYFASTADFLEDGVIYLFYSNKHLKEMKNIDVQNVKRKIHCIKNYNEFFEKNIVEGNNKKIQKSTIESNVILEYKKVFKTDVENIRYERQCGAFILFGNKLSEENKLLNTYNSLEIEKQVIIKKENKIENLYELSIQKGINYVFIFPDADISLKLISKNFLFIGQNMQEDQKYKIFITLYKQIFNIKIMNDKFLISKNSLLYKTLDKPNNFYFFFIEFQKFIFEIFDGNEEKIIKTIKENEDKSLKQLIKYLVKENY